MISSASNHGDGAWRRALASASQPVLLTLALLLGGAGCSSPVMPCGGRAAEATPIQLGAWQAMQPLPVGTTGHSAVVVDDWIYVLGGVRGITLMWAPLDADGRVGAWRQGRLPDWLALYGARALTVGRRLYMVGGQTDASRPVNVASAEVRADGSLGAWVPSTNTCPAFCGGTAVVGTNLYYVGGWYARQGFASSLAADGSAGPWRRMPNLISPRGFVDLLASGNSLYMVGGNVGHTVSGVKATTYRGVLAPDGVLARWESDEPLPVGAASYGGTVAGDVLLVAGGLTFSGRTANVWATRRRADGTLRPWQALAPLPQPVEAAAAVCARGRIYVLGGTADSPGAAGVFTNTVYAATVE